MNRDFYHDLPRLTQFSQIFEAPQFRDVPADWWVACTDVVGSTKAIEAGHYKQVNSAGSLAAMAIGNHFGGMDFPFFFGGDGMICLVPARDAPAVGDLLAGTAERVEEAFGLELRVGLVPVEELRNRGKTLRLAKLQVSPHYCQAILEGDGFDEADRLLKEPDSPYRIAPRRPRTLEPNFDGYTCRWEDFPSPKDETVALIVRFRQGDPEGARAFVRRLDALIGSPTEHHPLRLEAHRPAGARRLSDEIAVRTRGRGGWAWFQQWTVIRLQMALTRVAVAFQWPLRVGRSDLSQRENNNLTSSDYRKYDNTLKMVVALDRGSRGELERLLAEGRAGNQLFYGVHVTDRAMITCLLHTGAGHEVHFVDAADGGYAYAARQLKRQMQEEGAAAPSPPLTTA